MAVKLRFKIVDVTAKVLDLLSETLIIGISAHFSRILLHINIAKFFLIFHQFYLKVLKVIEIGIARLLLVVDRGDRKHCIIVPLF